MADKAKQVFDYRAGKGITAAQSDEHQRNWSEKGWDFATKTGNYDRTREHLNFEVTKGGLIIPVDKSRTITGRMADNLKERGIVDPNDKRAEPKFRTVVNIIFGGSRWRMHELAFGNQKVNLSHGADNSRISRSKDIEKWAQDMYRFTCEQWGEQNVIAFIVHLDEMNPHVHCTLLPIKDGKFKFKEIFAGKDKYEYKERTSAIHDKLAKINEKWGLFRGDRIAETGARHRSTEEYRRALSSECTTLEEQIESNRGILQQLISDIRFAEKRVKGLSTMVANLESRKKGLIEEMENVAADLKAGKGDSEALQKQISKLDFELEKVLDRLSDKRAKLEDADTKLSELKKLEEETRKRASDYRLDLKEATYDLERQVRFRLSDALLGSIVEDFHKQFDSLSGKGQDVFNDSLLKDIAEQGENIFRCAIYLYANYVDLATTFAENHGGGGGGNELEWGRKEDEDDRAWARRCLLRAHKMLKPSGSKNVRRKG